MKGSTILSLVSFLATAGAYPVTNSLEQRDCQPGALVCKGVTQFGICDGQGKQVWMAVSEGTECKCSGSSCAIAALSGGSSGSPPPADQQEPPKSNPGSGDDDATPPPPPQTTASQPAPPPSSTIVPVPTSAAHAPASSSPPAAEPSSPLDPGAVSGGLAPGGSSESKSYIKTFLGNGSPSEGWPNESEWASFENLWSMNQDVIANSCAAFDQPLNTKQETSDLKSAIESVAKSSGVDERFILAMTLQESNGCVRAPTTNYGVTNPGLMQSHNGAHSCYNVNPCSSSEITGMIQDGVEGTSSGDGLKQVLAAAGASDGSQYYKAARMYNSGSIASSGLLEDGIATHCYASDIANRLIGWSKDPTGCSI